MNESLKDTCIYFRPCPFCFAPPDVSLTDNCASVNCSNCTATIPSVSYEKKEELLTPFHIRVEIASRLAAHWNGENKVSFQQGHARELHIASLADLY